MSTEEDECDSSNLFTVASQSDITSFLHAQTAKIIGLSSDNDDDGSLIDNKNLLKTFPQNKQFISKKSFLNHSCFTSISSKKLSLSDDLTELKWLNTFQFKEFPNKNLNNNNQISQLKSILNNFPSKATVKTKVLPRLYERLCEEKLNNEIDSNSDHKHFRSVHRQEVKNNENKRRSSSPIKLTKQYYSSLNKNKQIENLLINENDDESNSNLSINQSILTTRSQISSRNIKNSFIHRRKSSSPKKRLSPYFFTHQPNTCINKKIIEQDLELLRQDQPFDLSSNNNNNNLLNQSSTR